MVFKTTGTDTQPGCVPIGNGGYQSTERSLDRSKPPQQGSGLNGDPWKHRSEGMVCRTCMYFCNMRCRRHAPTMEGFPAAFSKDWCGDHKLDKTNMGGE